MQPPRYYGKKTMNNHEEMIAAFASAVDTVRPETSDDIPVSSIKNLFETDEFLILQHGSRVSVFNKEGKYLNDIGSKGQGPNEFSFISSVFVKDRLFYLYDVSHKHILMTGSTLRP